MYENIEKPVKQFILTAVGLSLVVWEISFDLGAFQTIFFDKLFFVWTVCTVVLLTFIFLPRTMRPVRWPGVAAMVLPSVWLLLTSINQNQTVPTALQLLETGVVVIITLLCLPYIGYVIISVSQAEVLTIQPRKLMFTLVIIALLIGLAGYLIGANNDLFLTCQDFKVSGNDLPDNCRSLPGT